VLSPDAPECLTGAVRSDTVYVVGGLCDYKRIANATLDRAAAANVEARRLPLREAFGNNFSVNILTVNQTVDALCRAWHNGGDWADALGKALPKRKMEEHAARLRGEVLRNRHKREKRREDVDETGGGGDDDDDDAAAVS
jgi:Trm5-related predicted tRNA methylase